MVIKNPGSEVIESLQSLILSFKSVTRGTCVLASCSHLKESGILKQEFMRASGLLSELVELKKRSQFEVEFTTFKSLSLEEADTKFKADVKERLNAYGEIAAKATATGSLAVSTVYLFIQALF